jgi:hypothetical protein
METLTQGNTNTSLFSNTKFLAITHEPEANAKQGGNTIAYFLWVYVIIFSTIMVAVIIAERFFIQ